MNLRKTTLPRTAEGIAVAELRDAIVRGDLSVGAKIRQGATAKELGISVIPVREALKTLAGEGLLTYEPQRGYFVTELRGSAIQEIYSVRELIEGEAERLAIPRLTQVEISGMREHLRTQAAAAERTDAPEMIAANRHFHFTLLERCENRWLLRFLEQLWDTTDPYRILSYRRMWLDPDDNGLPAEILTEHERILEALDNGDIDGSLRLLHNHRRRSETFLFTLVEGKTLDVMDA